MDLTDEAEEYEAEGHLDDWRGDMRQLLIGAPVLVAVPIWTSNRDNPIEGSGWIAPIVVVVIFIPIWLMFGKLFLAFRTIFAAEEEHDKRQRLGRIAERELKIRRVERLTRARARLVRIEQASQAKEQHRMALDVDKIRRSLDNDLTNDS